MLGVPHDSIRRDLVLGVLRYQSEDDDKQRLVVAPVFEYVSDGTARRELESAFLFRGFLICRCIVPSTAGETIFEDERAKRDLVKRGEK